MQPENRDNARLWDMLVWAKEVLESTENLTFVGYEADKQLRLATERRLEIIGEAARHVSIAFMDAHKEIPWKAIIGMRNILAHEYGDVRNERVYRTASQDMAKLIKELERLVPNP